MQEFHNLAKLITAVKNLAYDDDTAEDEAGTAAVVAAAAAAAEADE